MWLTTRAREPLTSVLDRCAEYEEEIQIGSGMKFVGKMRGLSRRLTVAVAAAAVLPGLVGVVGGSATAGAWSRPGLPVEYLEVPSAGMGRDIKVEFQSLSLIHISEPTRLSLVSRMPSSA